METADMSVRAAASPNATLPMIQSTFECSPEQGNWPRCMADVGGPIGAHRIVWGRLDYRAERWLLKLRMLDVKTRHMIKALDRTLVDSAGSVDRLLTVADNFVRPSGSTEQIRAQLRIVSAPPKAKVMVDGLEVSPTPVTVPVAPGAHEVIATVPEVGTERRLVQAGPGETLVSFRFIAARETPETVTAEVPDLKLDWRFWSGMGCVGLTAIGAAGFIHFESKASTDLNLATSILNDSTGPDGLLTTEEANRYEELRTRFERNTAYRNSMFFGAVTAAIAGGVLIHLWAAEGVSLAPTGDGVALVGTF